MAHEILSEAASKALAAVNRPSVTDTPHWRDVPTLPAGIYEVTESPEDKQIILKFKRNRALPELGRDGKAYCFEWASGKALCAFRRKKHALAWMEDDQRDVVRFWYGEPVVGERKITVRTKYTGDPK